MKRAGLVERRAFILYNLKDQTFFSVSMYYDVETCVYVWSTETRSNHAGWVNDLGELVVLLLQPSNRHCALWDSLERDMDKLLIHNEFCMGAGSFSLVQFPDTSRKNTAEEGKDKRGKEPY